MTIKSFYIEGLFNRFNHRIDFENDVTIIIGKNGVGKTTCLELLFSLFNNNYSKLREIPYKAITIEFTDGEKCTFKYNKVLDVYNSSTKETKIIETIDSVTPDFLLNKIVKNKVNIIKSQRLIEFGRSDISGKVVPRNKALLNADNLSKLIKDTISKASDIAANLDKTFPSRLLSNKNEHNKHTEELKKNLVELENKRHELSNVGLLATEPETDNPQTDNISESSANVLNLYIQDSWAKLKAYDDISLKLSLFSKIINSRFLYKKITIDKDKGYYFIDDKGDSIPVEKLSSGEQNELVMFYNMLFECSSNNLILIDEPEISMHVEWLNNMMPDLLAISKLTGLKMLIATHSPDFIGEYWNLTTELK